MPRAQKLAYYAVKVGRVPGIYRSWTDCEAQVKGFKDALYKKVGTEADAIDYIAGMSTVARTPATRDIVPIASSSRAIVVSEPKVLPRALQTALPVPADEKDADIVYCDGACKGNGQPGAVAGIGVWWGHNDPRNISERCPGDQTNNRAELIAIVRILETTPRLKRRLLIKTDSKYSIQCVTSWIFKWINNGFLGSDGKPVKNTALIKYLAALLHVRLQTSQRVEFRHVRGHVGIEGNEAADRLANLGATEPTLLERDWKGLEKRALQSLVDDDLKAYADALLDDDELAELSDMSVDNVTLPRQQSHPSEDAKAATRSLTPLQASPPRTDVGEPTTATPGIGAAVRHTSKSSSRNAVPDVRSAPPEKSTTAISKKEMEIFASYLLDDAKLAMVGKDGIFDSDF